MYLVSYEYNVRKEDNAVLSSSMVGTGGTTVLQTETTVSPMSSFATFRKVFTPTDASMELTFTNTNSTTSDTDRSVGVANVSLSLAPLQKPTNLVRDGSFENGTYGSGYIVNGGSSTANPRYANLESTGIWTTETVGICSDGKSSGYYSRPTSSNNSWMLGKPGKAPDGVGAAGIQNYNAQGGGTCTIQQSLDLEAGRYYAVSYQYNGRNPYDAVTNPQTIAVTVRNSEGGDTVIQGNTQLGNTAFVQKNSSFQAETDVVSLRFSNVTTTSADSTIAVDDVHVVALPTEPMAAGMTPVHVLDLTTSLTTNYRTADVPYTYNASSTLKSDNAVFDRVGYYMELMNGSGDTQTCYVTMDAYTLDPTKIGLYTRTSLAKSVKNLDVTSNVTGLSRTIDRGNLEFFSSDYEKGPDGKYDSIDNGYSDKVGHGCFQIFDTAANTTLLAFSGWGNTNYATAAIGGTEDYTMTSTIKNGTWQVANLYTFVEESQAALCLGTQMFQRNGNAADVTLKGEWNAVSNDTIAGIRVSEDGVNWMNLENFSLDTVNKTFTGVVNGLSTGWHDFQIQAFDSEGNTLTSTTEKIGVGDIYITSGDANAANYGDGINRLTAGNVYALDVSTGVWQLANDQQPGTSTLNSRSSGSAWVEFGETTSEALDGVPIGIVSTAVADSDMTTWDPVTGSNYGKLKAAIEAVDGDFTALLWDSGRTDNKNNVSGTDYQQTLSELITATQGLTDEEFAWFVALESLYEGQTDAEILAAQLAVIDGTDGVYAGPNLDLLAGYLNENGYLTSAGLTALANGWFAAIGEPIYGFPEPGSWSMLLLGLAYLFRRRK